MRDFVFRWFKLYEDEITIFVWTAVLLFLIRSSGMILNNYAETTFLKRYGVEYLPIVNMANSIATFLVTGILAAFMARVSDQKLLGNLFIFCGIVAAAIRFLIPMGYDLIYPILYMLKSQFELLQALLFWNLANDLFNTRQSKRIFPLLTAGGVVGLIIGGFGTPYIIKFIRFDNLLLIYVATTFVGAAVVKVMTAQLPGTVGTRKPKSGVGRPSIMEEFRKVLPLIRESTLIKIVLVLTFMPNVVIVILNYQFNYAVNEYFASESGMITFFGYYRGVLNVISLFILLFVGRLYARFGLSVALMFHPLNYVIAFMAFFLRFDIFSAMYARMSANIIRTTINQPASSILIGLFPESYRAMVRPFLRGTVVRLALFLGSGLILASTNYFHPRYLSLVALPFVLAWAVAPFILKRRYASILMDLISKNLLDLKGLEEESLGNLFRKDRVGEELARSFLNAKGEDAVWYARLLKNLNAENTDELIISALPGHDTRTRIQLLEMLSDQLDLGEAAKLADILDPEEPELTVTVLKTIKRIAPECEEAFDLENYMNESHPQVRGHAAGCLYMRSPEAVRLKIDQWLAADDQMDRRAGVIAAGETHESSYSSRLENMLASEENASIYADILRALARLSFPDINNAAVPFLDYPDTEVQRAAMEVVEVTDENLLNRMIHHLGDLDESNRELAREKIKEADYINGQTLIEALTRPNRRLRESVFELLESLGIKDVDLLRFNRDGLEQAYTCLIKIEALESLPDSRGRELLKEHLFQKKKLLLENIFRVLAIHDENNQMRTVLRGIFSEDSGLRANSVELLGDIMDQKLFNRFLPLLRNFTVTQAVSAGRKYFRLPAYESEEDLFKAFLDTRDWIEIILALNILKDRTSVQARLRQTISDLQSSSNSHVSQLAGTIVKSTHGSGVDSKEQIMDTALTIPDKILLLKNIAIFSGLAVSELGAIATVTEEQYYQEGETVITEGEPGDRVFLIISGEVAVVKGRQSDEELELDTMSTGDYFGEMALFENARRSATIRTKKKSRFLVLHKQEFNELVREYPDIALQICTALSHRLRHLQAKLTGSEK